MAMTSWSTTAANNVLANTGINMDEGMAPSALNDSIREIMAVLKTSIDTGSLTATGTTFNLVNATATTVNFAGAATTLAMGAGAAATATLNFTTGIALNTDAITTTKTTVTALAGATTLLTLGGTGATSVLAIPGTLEWSGTTGALTVAGGVYIAKKLKVVGDATFTNLAGTLSTAAQPNVTSLGTLTGLVLSGTITTNSSIDIYAGTAVAANRRYYGDASNTVIRSGATAIVFQDASGNTIGTMNGSTSALNFGSNSLTAGAITSDGGLQTFGANDSAGAGYRLVKVPNI